MSDREYAKPGILPDWMQSFADNELQKEGNPFDDIRELFKSKNDGEAVEARVEELRKMVGLDNIEKVAGKKGYSGPIEKQTTKNKFFRKVLFTGKHSQLVLMSVNGNEELGSEVHKSVDQFFRVEEGEAIFVLDGKKKRIGADSAIIVPAGTEHNVINASETELLKMYTIYSPPNHPADTVHKTKDDADRAKKHAHTIINLLAFAQELDNEGMSDASAIVDDKIKALQDDPLMAKDKDMEKLPEKYQKYKGLNEFIQNACRTSGGYASVPAIQDRIRKEFDDEMNVKNKDLESYIKHCLKVHKEIDPGNDNDGGHAGEYVAIIVTDDRDGNQSVFDDPSGIK